MSFVFRITQSLATHVRRDLSRVHDFAFERVGFIAALPAATSLGTTLLAASYHPVPDADYVDDRTVGAMMGPGALRMALQLAYNRRVSIFHVHSHDHSGMPWFSRVDLRENAKFVPDFFKVQSDLPHGAIVFSNDCMAGLVWPSREQSPIPFEEIVEVGAPMRINRRA